ncbi:MAG: hypothetical protein CMN86_08620 [Stappia sp.]|nr:hypothetical protein [Stappia sp.]
MAKLRLGLYGATALAGIAWPWYCIYQFIQETEALGLTDPIEIVNLFSEGVWANASAGFIAADLTLVLIASFVFYAAEGIRLKMKFWYLYIAVTFAVSFAFSFGLFMFNRERNMAASAAANQSA